MNTILNGRSDVKIAPEFRYDHTKPVQYKGMGYSKIIYKKQLGILARIMSAVWAILFTLIIIPLLVNFKGVKRLWKECVKGVAKKAFLVPQEVRADKAKDKKKNEKRHVAFGPIRVRKFDKKAPPNLLGKQNSYCIGG